jgi:hypothetical protein
VAGDTKEGPSFSGGKLIIACAIVSFCIGVGFFLTIAQSKSGDPIPPDAAPNYYVHDAG